MKKIAVLVDGQLYAWVDTIVLEDEKQDAIAVLINPNNGKVFLQDIKNIKVIDLVILLWKSKIKASAFFPLLTKMVLHSNILSATQINILSLGIL